MKKVLFTLFGGCLCVAQIAAQTIFVSPTGTGAGSSWTDAAALPTALSSAVDGTQLWLTGGTYLPTTCTACEFSDRENRFALPSGVSLYGGFVGTEATVDERLAGNAPTVLSGDIDQDGTSANNSFTILYTVNASASTTVDGITFRGGRADVAQADADSPFASGGAWYNQGVLSGNNSSPVIRDCRFENNYALRFGGAFYHHASFGGGGNVVIENCVFVNNSSESDGGAMYLEASFGGTSSTSISGTLFSQNQAQLGKAGAIMNQGGENGFAELLLTDCQFTNNTSFSNGGAICNFGRNGNAGGTYTNCTFDGNAAVFGAAVYNNGAAGGTSSPVVIDCTFTNGDCGNEGGALYNNGFQGNSSPTLTRCTFSSNTADGSGGALFNNGVQGISSPRIDRCRFEENTVINYGAAIYNFGKTMGNASPVITNSLFRANSGTSGGAVYSLGSESGNANPIVTNCTFVDNSASVGGAIYANGNDSTGTSAPIITNCIFEGNEAPTGHIFRAISATITVRYSALDVADCDAAWTGIDGNLVCENSTFYNVDPQFENPAQQDYRLAEGSPLIDAGLNGVTGIGAFDLLGNDRLVDGTVDLGAYEYGTVAVQPTVFNGQPQSATRCAGEDLTLSAAVTGAAPLAYQWYLNGGALSGETATELILTNLQTADAGSYYLAVTNAEGTVLNSDSAEITVNPILIAAAAISASGTSICPGETIDFSATVDNPGATPVYTWYRNGSIITDIDTTAWSAADLNDGDQIYFQLNSSALCVSEALVNSDTIEISVQTALTPSVTFTASYADTLCLDSLAIFTALAADAGGMPAFAWELNGTLTGDTTASYTSTQLQDGDVLSVIVTSSAACATQPTAAADDFVVLAKACAPPTGVRNLAALTAAVHPNPFHNSLLIDVPVTHEALRLRLADTQGRTYHERRLSGGATRVRLDTATLPAGGYVLTITGRTQAFQTFLIRL